MKSLAELHRLLREAIEHAGADSIIRIRRQLAEGLLFVVESPARGDSASIDIASGVSAFDRSGYVQVRWGHEAGQMTPAEARQHGLAILEAAEAAESDSAVYRQLIEDIDMPHEAAVGFVAALRHRRNGS